MDIHTESTTKPLTFARLFGRSRGPARNCGFDSIPEFLAAITAHQIDPSEATRDERLQAYFASLDGASTGVATEGGFAVPETLLEVLLNDVLADAPLLNVFQPIPMTTPGVMVPSFDAFDTDTFAGITGAWVAELEQLAQEKPALTLTTMKSHKFSIFAPFSNELIEDSPTTLDQVSDGMVALVRRQWEAAILAGDGVGKPLGILNSPSTITETRTDTGRIRWTDVKNLWARCAFRSSAVWIANWSSLPDLLDLAQVLTSDDGATAVTAYPIVRADSRGNLYILRRPVIFTDAAPALGSAGDLTLASPLGYVSGLRRGISSAKSADFYFAADALAIRITLRLAGQSIFQKPWTPRNGDSQSWAVTLAA